ncbi:uncharacterized protein LOC122465237 [Chelonia mydas]|uniref:uncharacterized protein LOC122465237 n=1 Tax=Chelonia mydas TaxID=8469 RepID=UPI001CA8C22C|nr:uncharacterized protein LOC122465237 [Chelonia mydas]
MNFWQVAPEPEGSSCHLPQEQRCPFVPSGGEGAPGRARRWKRPSFWRRKPAPGTSAEMGGAEARPKWSCPRMRLGRQDSDKEGSQAGWLWGLLCGKHGPQEPSPDSQQEALPCPVTEDVPACPGQKVEEPCPSTSNSARSPWDSSSTWESGSSEAEVRRCFVPGTARDSEDEEEVAVDMAMRSLLSRTSETSSNAEKRWKPSPAVLELRLSFPFPAP